MQAPEASNITLHPTPWALLCLQPLFRSALAAFAAADDATMPSAEAALMWFHACILDSGAALVLAPATTVGEFGDFTAGLVALVDLLINSEAGGKEGRDFDRSPASLPPTDQLPSLQASPRSDGRWSYLPSHQRLPTRS